MPNILTLSDSYKVSHWKQYPPKTEKVYSYFESRGGDFNEVTFFGLQYFLKKYLEGIQVTEEKIQEAKAVWDAHLGPGFFNEEGWRHILEKHEGRLPVSIKAVPEGATIPTSNVLMTIENTDPECYWLTNYLETLLVQTWYPTTVCTLSRSIREMITGYLEATGDPEGVGFKLHDFGFRGVSSPESAEIGGAAHIVNFMGTDTIAGAIAAMKYYNCEMPAFSLPATEHSTMTAWGKEYENEAFRNVLDQYPEGLVACVSDSYDIYRACRDYWGWELKDKVLNRNGTLVVRPDSGDPHKVVNEVLEILGSCFGYEVNEKGYKVLPPQIRVIQGDGVDFDTIERIFITMMDNGWSADNIVFGAGGTLLQKMNRDTCKFAFKCSSATIDGAERDVYKEPVTDGGKRSKSGRLSLVFRDGQYETVKGDHPEDILTEVFRDGEVLVEHTFGDVRNRSGE